MEPKTEIFKQHIKHVLARYPAVEAAYLFGSHAEGGAGPDSDLDIALLGARTELEPRKLDILADLTAEGMDRIDLVLLEGADPVLRFEVVHSNCLIYARMDFDHPAYFTDSLMEYFDLEPYLAIQREGMKQRLRDGKT